LPVIVAQLGSVSLPGAIGYGVLITIVLIVARIICTLGASLFTVFISRYITTADSQPGWRGPLIIGWAGMRGVVSLAAALSVPLYLDSGPAFPQRNLILFITFTVILLTLILQGLSLPLVIRWVNMKDPDRYLPAAEEELLIRRRLAEHSLKFLDEEHYEAIKINKPVQELRARLETDKHLPDHENTTKLEDYRKIYLQLLMKQREFLQELNKMPGTDEGIIRKYQGLLDLEEEKLRMKY
jgi:monovalent cation/hydrogen antiporter